MKYIVQELYRGEVTVCKNIEELAQLTGDYLSAQRPYYVNYASEVNINLDTVTQIKKGVVSKK